jgi:cytosolic carboxypeptidase protein 2/3
MIRKESGERSLRMFIDLHGHSRKKNVFFYGCCEGGQKEEKCARAKAFPYLMSKIHDSYSYENCAFNVQKDKEGTARVTLFKEFKI